MVVRLTRLATGKVIGDLLARSMVPVTEDVREKIRTMNQVAMNMVTVIGVLKMQLVVYLNIPLRGHLYGTWNLFSQLGGTCQHKMIRSYFP